MKFVSRAYWFIALLLLAGCDADQAPMQVNAPALMPSAPAAMTPLQRAEAGKALWEEKCRTVAGEKIYKTVLDVEGLVLLKVRPKAWEPEWADPMWPGAAFALEGTGEHYINTFLGYEEAFAFGGVPRPITKEYRGYINTWRPRKLSATPDLSGKVLPHVISRTQHRRTRHDPGKPLAWHGTARDCPPA